MSKEDASFVRPVLYSIIKRARKKHRTYARMTGVDVLSANLFVHPRATLRQCQMLCDTTPGCNYIVRNISILFNRKSAAAAMASQQQQEEGDGAVAASLNPNLVPTECWIKKPFVFDPVRNPHRETWVVARAPMPVIAIGVLAAPALIETRLVAAYATWLKHEDTIVMLENTTEARQQVLKHFGPRAAQGLPAMNNPRNSGPATGGNVLFLFENEERGNGTTPGAWKNLLLFKYLPREFRRLSSAPAEWYLLVDDDTFAIMPTLRFMLAVASSKENIYTGLLMAAMDYTKGAPFIQGGAGIVMSHETLHNHVYGKLDCCIALCKQKFGDFRTGCCVTQAAKTMGMLHHGFYSFSAWKHTASTEQRKRYGLPLFPVTFHRFRQAPMIYAFHQHIDAFLKRTHTVSSRYILHPIDPKQHVLRDESLTQHRLPMDRQWAFVDDLIDGRMMNRLPPLPPASSSSAVEVPADEAALTERRPFTSAANVTKTTSPSAANHQKQQPQQPQQQQQQIVADDEALPPLPEIEDPDERAEDAVRRQMIELHENATKWAELEAAFFDGKF